MLISTSILLVLLAAPQATTPPSDGDAGRVYSILTRLQDQAGKGYSYTVRQADLNAFIKMEVARQAPPAIKELSVDLGAGRFTTLLKVDMDDLNLENQGMAASLLGSMMSGVQEVVVTGSVETEAGRGTYTTQEASLNGMTLPATLVDLLLSAIGSRQNPPFDPTEPFRLPNGIQTITVRKGVVELTN